MSYLHTLDFLSSRMLVMVWQTFLVIECEVNLF